MRFRAALSLFLCSSLAACAAGGSGGSAALARYPGYGKGKPPIVHCFDGVPHIKGSLPFILGGTCVHSPTPEVLSWYHRDGLLLDYDWERLKALYADRGIKTIYDHKGCNNYCPWGPHLVKGGHCMVPPTPGTRNYEEVLSGWFAPLPSPKESESYRILIARVIDSRQSVTHIPIEEVDQ